MMKERGWRTRSTLRESTAALAFGVRGVLFRPISTACRWIMEKYKAPAFVGGPYQIWGLTGYILHRLVNDVIRQHLAVM